MSGVVKGVGKVFKKVAKVVKEVAPIALAVGAIVFTGGAALGLAMPTWGAAVSGVLGTTGIGGVLAGAVTQAGYGAVIGAATAAVTGGSIKKGLQMGALTGAITGGITGAISPANIDPIGNYIKTGEWLAPTTNVGNLATAVGPNAADAVSAAGGAGLGGGGGGAAASSWMGPAIIAGGTALAGVGEGAIQAGAAKDEAAREEQRQKNMEANYRTGNVGLLGPNSPRVTLMPDGSARPGEAPAPVSRAAAQPQPDAGEFIPVAQVAQARDISSTPASAVAQADDIMPSNLRGRWRYDAQQGGYVLVPRPGLRGSVNA